MSRSQGKAAGESRTYTGLDGATFVLNGASALDAALIGADISAVTREVKTAVIFFRVTFANIAKWSDPATAIVASVEITDALSATRPYAILGRIVADSDGLLPGANQIDVLVTDAAGATIDTATLKVHLVAVANI